LKLHVFHAIAHALVERPLCDETFAVLFSQCSIYSKILTLKMKYRTLRGFSMIKTNRAL